MGAAFYALLLLLQLSNSHGVTSAFYLPQQVETEVSPSQFSPLFSDS